MLERVAREEARDRRTISWIQVAASLMLIASTLLAWENHPRVEYRGGAHPGFYVVEVSHSMGLVTRPAGIFAIAIGVVSLAGAKLLRKVHLRTGWLAFVLALGALATCAVEIVQLLLGRRDWLDSVTKAAGPSLLGQAIGAGVWLAALASVALVANTSTYTWLGFRLWRKNRDSTT
jgi:uncharacterized membrane protein